MGSLDRINEALATLGSEYRAEAGDLVQDGLAAIIEAIPGYIDRQIKAALDARETKE